MNLLTIKNLTKAYTDKVLFDDIDFSVEEGEKVGIICTDESRAQYIGDVIESIGSRQDEDSIAQHLYAILRDFDEMDVNVIFSESFATPRIGHAIMNRLLKAAGHQVIEV